MKPVLHRYIIEIERDEVYAGWPAPLLALAGVPDGRIPFATASTTNPLSGLARIEFRLFVDADQTQHKAKS